jgi:hypothetical protein
MMSETFLKYVDLEKIIAVDYLKALVVNLLDSRKENLDKKSNM